LDAKRGKSTSTGTLVSGTGLGSAFDGWRDKRNETGIDFSLDDRRHRRNASLPTGTKLGHLKNLHGQRGAKSRRGIEGRSKIKPFIVEKKERGGGHFVLYLQGNKARN